MTHESAANPSYYGDWRFTLLRISLTSCVIVMTLALAGGGGLESEIVLTRDLANGTRAVVFRATFTETYPVVGKMIEHDSGEEKAKAFQLKGGDVENTVATLVILDHQAPYAPVVGWVRSQGLTTRWHEAIEMSQYRLSVYDVEFHDNRLFLAYSIYSQVRLDVVEEVEEGKWELQDTIELFEQHDGGWSMHLVHSGRFVLLDDEMFLYLDVTRRHAKTEQSKDMEVWRVTLDGAAELNDDETETIEAVRRAAQPIETIDPN